MSNRPGPPGPTAYGVPVPERACGVKGLLGIFCAHGPRQSLVGLFPRGLGLRCGLGTWLSRSLCCEVVRAVLFSCGGTPIHPFVNLSADTGSQPGPGEPDTEYSAATVPQTPAVSIRITLGKPPPSPRGHSDWHQRLRGPLPKGRADATVVLSSPLPPLPLGDLPPRLFYNCFVR